jgi:hypothetical protein
VVIPWPTVTLKPAASNGRSKMQPLGHLANELNRERLAHASEQRPARRLLAYRRNARRAQRRMRNAVREALRLRTDASR